MNNASKIIISKLKGQIKKLEYEKEVLEQALSNQCLNYEEFCNAINIAKIDIINRHIRNLISKMRNLK